MLEEIVAAGELEATLGLLPLALVSSPATRVALLDALDRLVRNATPEALAWLDLRARTLAEWRREGWAWSRDVTPAQTSALSTAGASAAGIASLHNDGYVRQAAVEVLAASEDPWALPFLLLRANDWVVQVREAAVRGIDQHLSRGGAGPFVPYLGLVDRLTSVRRNDLQPLADRILASLSAGAGAPALAAGCASPDRAVRRRCIGLALAARTFDLKALVRAGLDDPDSVVRILVAKGAAKALEWPDLEPLLKPMLASTTPAARYAALDILWTRHGEGSRSTQERFLLDPHSHVRGTARWFLKTIPGFDSVGFYRSAVQSVTGTGLVGALEGLGEVGGPPEAALVVPFLHHSRAVVRMAAIRAIGAVGSDLHREAIIAALSDPSPKVCRAARQILVRGSPVDPERLILAALQSRFPHERQAAIELAGDHDHWVAGLLLLRIAAAGDVETSGRASAALGVWESRYGRVFTKPTQQLVEEFEALLGRAQVDPRLLGKLRDLIPAMRLRSKGA
jgi:HEAT repeat protein